LEIIVNMPYWCRIQYASRENVLQRQKQQQQQYSVGDCAQARLVAALYVNGVLQDCQHAPRSYDDWLGFQVAASLMSPYQS
jgi:hypothetical protein